MLDAGYSVHGTRCFCYQPAKISPTARNVCNALSSVYRKVPSIIDVMILSANLQINLWDIYLWDDNFTECNN